MNAGDIVLVHRTGPISRTIEWFTGSYFSHAAIVCDGHLVEAHWTGIRRVPLTAYGSQGTVFTVAGATEANRRVAVAWAERCVGEPYGWRDLLADVGRDALHLSIGYRWRHWGRRWGLDCSCLVTACWWQAGIDLTDIPVPAPADLGWSPILIGPRPWLRQSAGSIETLGL